MLLIDFSPEDRSSTVPRQKTLLAADKVQWLIAHQEPVVGGRGEERMRGSVADAKRPCRSVTPASSHVFSCAASLRVRDDSRKMRLVASVSSNNPQTAPVRRQWLWPMAIGWAATEKTTKQSATRCLAESFTQAVVSQALRLATLGH